MSNELKNLVREAKSQAREERLKNFFATNKKIVKASAIAVASLLVVFLIFSFIQKSRQEKFSAILHQSLVEQQFGDMEKTKENLKKIYDAKSAPSGVRAVASLRYAAFLLQDGKVAESVKIYQEINECMFCDAFLKDLAGLLAIKVWMSDEVEVAKEDLAARLEKIEKSSKPLKHYITEQRALLEMKKNNLEKSYQIFNSIAMLSEISPVLKERAELGLRMVAAKGFEPKVEVKSEEKKDEKAKENDGKKEEKSDVKG